MCIRYRYACKCRMDRSRLPYFASDEVSRAHHLSFIIDDTTASSTSGMIGYCYGGITVMPDCFFVSFYCILCQFWSCYFKTESNVHSAKILENVF